MIRLASFLILTFSGRVFSAPVDEEPIRVDLPVYEKPQSGSEVELAESFEKENHPAISRQENNNIISNLISQKVDFASNAIGNSAGGILSDPNTKIESAARETEDFGSQALSVKENLHNVIAGIFQPKPIVDTIREEEKYGNTGDKFYTAGRAIVGGAENISNFVNSALGVPSSFWKVLSRSATEKLNNLGARLVGL